MPILTPTVAQIVCVAQKPALTGQQGNIDTRKAGPLSTRQKVTLRLFVTGFALSSGVVAG